jgi:hypothetical protein
VKELLEDNPEIIADIESKIRAKSAAGAEVVAVQPGEAAEG